jgi:hypothetical protein
MILNTAGNCSRLRRYPCDIFGRSQPGEDCMQDTPNSANDREAAGEARAEQTAPARREVLATIGRFAYVAPALALLAEPKFAHAGYGRGGGGGGGSFGGGDGGSTGGGGNGVYKRHKRRRNGGHSWKFW